MKHALLAYASILVATICLLGAFAPAADPMTGLASDAQATAVNLRQLAVDQISEGEFRDGAATLGKLRELAPNDVANAKLIGLVDGFIQRRDADEARRQKEYAAAVNRCKTLIRLAKMPERLSVPSATVGISTAPPTKGDRIGEDLKTLRDTYRAIRTLLTEGPVSEDEDSQTSRPSSLPEGALTRIDAIRDGLDRISKEVGSEGEFAEVYGEVAADVGSAIKAFRQAVAQQTWGDLEQNKAAYAAVADQNDALATVLDELGGVFSESPIRSGLGQLSLTRQISLNPVEFLTQPWVVEGIELAEDEAKRLADQKQWYDALAMYNTLEELRDDNKIYKKPIHLLTSRARVLSMYGPGEADRDFGDEPVPNDKWERYVEGIDASMINLAVSRMRDGYVKNVDYQKLLLGALEAVHVLVTTDTIDQTFEGLKDKGDRDRFLNELEKQIGVAEKMDVVEPARIGRFLNDLLDNNRKTVRIPPEVVMIEYGSGMMDQLDTFSAMIWPSDWPAFKKATLGKFSGVGIQIQMENGLLKVVSPLEDSPAYRAGIHADDLIVEIDGKTARNIDIDEAVQRISGPENTQVVLTVERPGVSELLKFPLVREEIQIKTIKGWKRVKSTDWDYMIDPANQIGYIRLTSFTRETTGDLEAAMAELKDKGVRGLILDLRFNPGGYLTTAEKVADEFMSHGRIVSTKGRQQLEKTVDASDKGTFQTGEMVVLVNQASASAAEIVSGALKDWKRATIVGVRSFGKGSVQNLIAIQPDQTYLKLTTAYYYLPLGRCLHRTEDATSWGVEPDVHVPMTPQQMRKWLNLRRHTEIIVDGASPDQVDREMDELRRADIQLDTALLMLQIRLTNQELLAAAK